jgi:hypothetical protein
MESFNQESAMPIPEPTSTALLARIRLRPRYLRAIPSLVVLTTAMAWGALPDWDVGDDLHKKAGLSQSQPLNSSGGGDGPAGRHLVIK